MIIGVGLSGRRFAEHLEANRFPCSTQLVTLSGGPSLVPHVAQDIEKKLIVTMTQKVILPDRPLLASMSGRKFEFSGFP